MTNNVNLRRCNKRTTLLSIVAACLVFSVCYYNRIISIWELKFGAAGTLQRDLVLGGSDLSALYFDDRYTLKTQGCVVERIDPWDPTFKKYFKKLSAPKCSRKPADILIQLTDDGYLKVDSEARKQLIEKYDKNKDLVCQKRAVYRHKYEKRDHNGSWVSENVTEFKEWSPMDTEFAQVKCFVGGTNVYQDYFATIVRKPDVEAECKAKHESFMEQNPQCKGHPRLSVLLVGIDSLSKANFLRHMPMTFDYVVNNLLGIDLLGYNKVGLNTFPSLIPYLTGNSTQELGEGCWGGGGTNTFDNCTFLWDLFGDAGYRTAFVENLDDFGLFVFNKGGNHRQVAHYYGHTVYIPVLKQSMKKGCWRGIADDQHVVDWALRFQREFANDSHYGHFWMSRFSHDDLNTAQHLDPIIYDLFKQMYSENILNNTLLIFMSDHGIRFGDFRETETGRQEENLPFMYLIFPRWFKERYPAAITRVRENRQRLVTAFDLHETLKALINCDFASSSSGGAESKERGISLFKPISTNRTCDDAGIPAIYCGCRENVVEMDTTTVEANKLAQLLVDQLNAYTQHVRDICVQFYLKTILTFKQVVQLPDDPSKKKPAIRNTHIISILVTPGDAKFEATIQLVTKNNSYIVNDDVRRINRYGDTSYCISNDGFLKSVCYCGHN